MNIVVEPGAHPRLRRWLSLVGVGALLALCGLSAGCSTYATGAREVRLKTAAGDMPGALELLEKRGGDDPDVLNLMERGLLLHYEEDYEASNQLFQLADQKIEDLYTKSVSGEVMAFLTNDGNRPYSGYPHEQILIHLYGALNYLHLGDREGALVECRRVSERLAVLEDIREDKEGYTDDAFVEWLAGKLYAAAGDGNAAMVSARRARAAYEEYYELWGLPVPPDLVVDHIRWARRFGFGEEADTLAVAHPQLAELAQPLDRHEGELVLVYESGFVDALEEQALSFPIFKRDKNRYTDNYATVLMSRGHRGALYVNLDDDVEIDYWLQVALPTMVHTPPLWNAARLRVGDEVVSADLVADLSAVAQLTFEEGQTGRIFKTILRALAKYKITQQTKKKKGALAGWLMNAGLALSERADTRSWTLLPDSIHLARLALPEGYHEVVVEVLDTSGHVVQTATFGQVEIRPGEMTLLEHRSWH